MYLISKPTISIRPAYLNISRNLIFLCLTLLVPILIFNRPLFVFLNSNHHYVSDIVWLSLTTLGDGLVLGITMGLFLFFYPRIAVLAIVLMIGSAIPVHFIKAAFPAFRPVVTLDSVHVLGPILRSGSFPSGHTAAAFSAALAFLPYVQSRTKLALIFMVALLIAASRIFVGAHYPLDLVAGSLCALFFFQIFAVRITGIIEGRISEYPDPSSRTWTFLVTALFFAAILCGTVHAHYKAELPIIAVVISFTVLVIAITKILKTASQSRLPD